MKKILYLHLFFCIVLSANAQYHLGDYYELDGVPSIVVYVDSSGEHGMVMSYPAVIGDRALEHLESKSMIPLSLANKYRSGEISYYTEKIEEHGKNVRMAKDSIRKDVYSKLTTSGEQNKNIIAEYIAENRLNITNPEQYFPDYLWAKRLGNGWFIPGDDELELVMSFYMSEASPDWKWKTFVKYFKNIEEKYLSEYGFRVRFHINSSTRNSISHYPHSLYFDQKRLSFGIHNGRAIKLKSSDNRWHWYHYEKDSFTPFEKKDGKWILGNTAKKASCWSMNFKAEPIVDGNVESQQSWTVAVHWF